MNITIDMQEGRTVLAFRGELTIDHAAEIRDALLKAIGSSDSVSLDLSAVTEADVSFMQLVCSTHKSAREAGKEVSLRASSEAMWRAVDTAGFFHHRGCAASLEPCVMAAGAARRQS